MGTSPSCSGTPFLNVGEKRGALKNFQIQLALMVLSTPQHVDLSFQDSGFQISGMRVPVLGFGFYTAAGKGACWLAADSLVFWLAEGPLLQPQTGLLDCSIT